MKNEEVLSNGKINKKVHWALNLEEIFYFGTETESKAAQSMLKESSKPARKACLEIFEQNFVRRLREGFSQISKPFSGHRDEVNFKDLNKTWDGLFEQSSGKYNPLPWTVLFEAGFMQQAVYASMFKELFKELWQKQPKEKQNHNQPKTVPWEFNVWVCKALLFDLSRLEVQCFNFKIYLANKTDIQISLSVSIFATH